MTTISSERGPPTLSRAARVTTCSTAAEVATCSFSRSEFGKDVIGDFGSGDKIRLAGTRISSFADLLAKAKEDSGIVTIKVAPGDTLTLLDVRLKALSAEAFTFT